MQANPQSLALQTRMTKNEKVYLKERERERERKLRSAIENL